MNYPDSVLTKDKKGNPEVRNLISRGDYVLYDYRDPKTFKQLENRKQKLYLKDETGEIKEYYIIPTAIPTRSLFITPTKIEIKERDVWNEKKKKAEQLWK